MKIWNGYSTEHSMNLVLIGKFKDVSEAEEAKEFIESLTRDVDGLIEVGGGEQKYSSQVMEVLRKHEIYIIANPELEQLLYEHTIESYGDKVVVTTEEADISAFIKIMIERGAKVEVYSAHEYPDEDYGRGK